MLDKSIEIDVNYVLLIDIISMEVDLVWVLVNVKAIEERVVA